MNKEEIMNTYAIEQGYESWESLLDVNAFCWDIIINHQNKVADLIQEELLKKATDEITKNKINWIMGWKEIRQAILNTEIL